MSWMPQIVTSRNASAMIGSPIFDAPATRSVNEIGTSTTLRPDRTTR